MAWPSPRSSWHCVECPRVSRHVQLCALQSVTLASGGDTLKGLMLLTYREARLGHFSKEDNKLLDVGAFFPESQFELLTQV